MRVANLGLAREGGEAGHAQSCRAFLEICLRRKLAGDTSLTSFH
jgi:hypothetical protein